MRLSLYKSYIDKEMIRIMGQLDEPSKILDYLYLGSEWNASNFEELKDKGIKVSAILPGATWSNSWAGADLPHDRIMEAKDIAYPIIAALKMSKSAVMEEIVLRPQLGDL